MKSLDFGVRLLLVLLLVTAIALSFMVFIISSNVHKSLESEALNYIEELSIKNAKEVENILNMAVVVTNSMANKYENAVAYNEKLSEEGTIEYLKTMLKSNSFLQGIWFDRWI